MLMRKRETKKSWFLYEAKLKLNMLSGLWKYMAFGEVSGDQFTQPDQIIFISDTLLYWLIE